MLDENNLVFVSFFVFFISLSGMSVLMGVFPMYSLSLSAQLNTLTALLSQPFDEFVQQNGPCNRTKINRINT